MNCTDEEKDAVLCLMGIAREDTAVPLPSRSKIGACQPRIVSPGAKLTKSIKGRECLPLKKRRVLPLARNLTPTPADSLKSSTKKLIDRAPANITPPTIDKRTFPGPKAKESKVQLMIAAHHFQQQQQQKQQRKGQVQEPSKENQLLNHLSEAQLERIPLAADLTCQTSDEVSVVSRESVSPPNVPMQRNAVIGSGGVLQGQGQNRSKGQFRLSAHNYNAATQAFLLPAPTALTVAGIHQPAPAALTVARMRELSELHHTVVTNGALYPIRQSNAPTFKTQSQGPPATYRTKRKTIFTVNQQGRKSHRVERLFNGSSCPAKARYEDRIVYQPPSNWKELSSVPRMMPVIQDSKREHPISAADIRPKDVLLGRGGHTNQNAGNQYFRSMIDKYRRQYFTIPKGDKGALARYLANFIRAKGGRFLKAGKPRDDAPSRNKAITEESPSMVYFEVGDAKAVAKVLQGLRETNLPEGRAQK